MHLGFSRHALQQTNSDKEQGQLHWTMAYVVYIVPSIARKKTKRGDIRNDPKVENEGNKFGGAKQSKAGTHRSKTAVMNCMQPCSLTTRSLLSLQQPLH